MSTIEIELSDFYDNGISRKLGFRKKNNLDHLKLWLTNRQVIHNTDDAHLPVFAPRDQ